MAAQTRDPANGPTEPLTSDEVVDTADTARRAAEPKAGGKRVRAIPAVITNGGDRATTVEIPKSSFASKGIVQNSVKFDFRQNKLMLYVGDGNNGTLSQEAADFLTENYPTSFEYMGD